ncbi:bacteriophage abortive infection AbiH family protein [Niallia sp. JL1B1071]|uniref:bacteriophage abortive infection AbiH family protein n=1 Tax=Niallia tiangongensis TaxID=3237105 RepID=UPI0037DC8325
MKLIICGNGFDIHHGFQTSYQAYKKFLLEKYPHSFRAFEEFQYIDLTNSDRWSDLENSLTINYEDCVSDSLSEFYPDLNNDSDSRWYDFQIDLEEQTKFIYDFTGLYLFEWLGNVDYTLAENKLDLNPNDLYVTFNYTSTLENVFEIPIENIFHIHGSIEEVEKRHLQNWFTPYFRTIEDAEVADQFQADEFNSGIVREHIQFGSIDNDPLQIKKDLEGQYGDDDFYTVSIEPGIDNLIDFCNVATKDIKKNYEALKNFIIQNEINQVIIMGHSIMGVDKAYYNDIIVPLLKECFWTFYYYNEENLADAERFVERFSVEKYEFVKW